MDRRLEVPGYVRWVTRTLEEEGYETWTVGGAVRNALLGLPSGDWDLATRAPPTVIQRLFPRTVPVGIEHGTVGVLTREGVLLEVTTFRRDVETFGRRAVVKFADTLVEDLARRDFTINAVAWHPMREEFQDPFRGRKDLEAGLLRTVGDPGERFSEDYLRVLRALRFSGRFRFRIHGPTWGALTHAVEHLPRLSPERIREELMKSLAECSRPSAVLSLYGATGVLEILYPELASLVGTPRPGREGEDLWVHSLLLMDTVPSSRPLLRLLALLQGLGAPAAKEGEEDHPGLRGRDRAAALMIRLRFSNAQIRRVTERIPPGPEVPLNLTSPPQIRTWLYEAGPETIPDRARLWLGKARLDALRWGQDPEPALSLISRIRREIQSGAPLRLHELALDGRDLIALGLKPSPRFGTILEGLMQRVLGDPSLNRRDRLLSLVELEIGEESE
jgi:tRNA nucleotidyltransferase/poly(A) polymerase